MIKYSLKNSNFKENLKLHFPKSYTKFSKSSHSLRISLGKMNLPRYFWYIHQNRHSHEFEFILAKGYKNIWQACKFLFNQISWTFSKRFISTISTNHIKFSPLKWVLNAFCLKVVSHTLKSIIRINDIWRFCLELIDW